RRRAREEAQRPFELSRGPLLRAKVLRLEREEHVLVLVMHHIVTDGWSNNVLLRELSELYAAFEAGGVPVLPELALQYADYAVWQRQWLQGEVLEGQLSYWKKTLAGAPQALELPTDRARPQVQTFHGAQLQVQLPLALSQEVRALSQREGATLFMTLLAALQALLARYSGQRDIVVGTPIAGRNRREVEGLIGFFVNTLALRTPLEGNPSFRELLGRVRQVALGAYAHQDIPFEKLVEELKPQRSLSHPPLFQVMFAFQNVPQLAGSGAEGSRPSLEMRPLEVEGQTAKFDLTLSLAETPEGLVGSLQYNTDLFESATAARMLGHFQVLLEAATSNPELPLASLPLLTPAERQQVLVAWNDTRAERQWNGCIHELFEEQAARTPQALAVVYEEGQLTFAELDGRANQLAHALRARGVGPEERVALCMERSLEMVVGVLGILKAGGAYVPMDPAYPAQRLAFMLKDSRARLVLTQERLREQLAEHGVESLSVDGETLSHESDTAPARVSGPGHLAYIIYTSGSTGLPKGVMIPHASVVNLRAALDETVYAGVEGALRVSVNAPLAFDASVKQLIQLANGHALCVIPQETRGDLRRLRAYLEKHRVEVLDCTPSLLRLMLAEGLGEPGAWAPGRVLVGGEAVDEATWATLSRHPRIACFNVYGPTECTVDATVRALRGAPVLPTIGRPLLNVSTYVLDERMEPTPVGVPGELYIGGAGLARGYHGRPELTAEKFVPHPFSTRPGARLYRTGDRVRYLPQGELEYLGRLDSQVKLRGFRIELGEIESALGQHPEVKQAAVLVRKDGESPERLVAYVVAREGQKAETGALRAFLEERLPEYMVPSVFMALEALPLTTHGKVDRKALPAPEASGAEERAYVAPRTPTEQLLASLWAQVLHTDKVGLHDNFFELGGHSLLATQVTSRVRSSFGVELPLRALFEAPTLEALASRLDSASREGQGLKLPPPRPVARTGGLPLSFAQQRLWFIEQLEPGLPTYHIPLALSMEGTLDVSALERSFQELVRRHESLRTTFHSTEQEAIQVIHPEVSLPLPVVDLSQLPRAEQEAQVLRLTAEEAQRPFELSRGPLLRVKVLRLAREEHVLVLVMHHIVTDGWSINVLLRELSELYPVFAAGGVPALPALALQYADYAVWQRQWLRGEVLEGQLSYWKKTLAGAPQALELPTDRARPQVQTFRGAQVKVQLPLALSQEVRALSQREGATLFMTLLAALQALLARYSGQRDIVVGTPVAGRNRQEVESLIGFFVNTLALRVDVQGALSFKELLAQVREACLGAYVHQELPFEKLVDALQLERDLSRTPLFQVLFVLENEPVRTVELGGLCLKPLEVEFVPAKLDLTVGLRETGQGLLSVWEYNTDLFDGETVARMAGHFQKLLEGWVARPEQRLWELPLLTKEERHRLLVEWNSERAEYPTDRTIHQLFEEQVERTPDAPAVDFTGTQLTYGELNRRANQLAHHLRTLGVGRETLVGICVERSLEMVVGILGILKAGGAYVPLDPSLPEERLGYMLENAGLMVLLTQEHVAEELPFQGRMVRLDSEWERIARQPEVNPSAMSGAGNLAYAIYTSGSTGRPKGTLLE
ncbi:non-ribosomal peptide synthetase, partial [Archangium sp.]|uniref:non-ribosomal peptide synthetase n=1 Tax=Archangium sp. TaxID=1872627 RepID=UPI002D5DBDFB